MDRALGLYTERMIRRVEAGAVHPDRWSPDAPTPSPVTCVAASPVTGAVLAGCKDGMVYALQSQRELAAELEPDLEMMMAGPGRG